MTYLGPRVLANFKPRRTPHKERKVKARDKRPGISAEHLANIRKLSSCVSGKRPCEAHHLRKKDERGTGLKATDRWALPLTWDEHLEIHRYGSRKEEAWFAERGIDCYALANALWQNRHDIEAMERVLAAHWEGRP